MCGFFGYYAENANFKDLGNIQNKLNHRGPNSYTIHTLEKFTLHFSRLAIVDAANVEANQPYFSGNRVYCINGEIYNYKKLKEAHFSSYKFKTNSDSELIIACFEKFGKEFTRYLDGMYSICIYDTHTNEIILARDNLGIKPLFYQHTMKGFFFGSERRLFANYSKELKVFPEQVASFFCYSSLRPGTDYIPSVKSLLPGEVLTVSLDTQNKISKYNYIEKKTSQPRENRSEIKKEIKQLLISAVEKRLIGDCEIGLYLSGGLDSSLIAAIMKKDLGIKNIKSFGIDFDSHSFTELKFQKYVAKKYDLKHTPIKFGIREMEVSILDSSIASDGPMLFPSSVALFKLSQEAAKEHKVILGGEGADEIFCGYPKYQLARHSQFLNLCIQLKKIGITFPNYGKLSTVNSLLLSNPRNLVELYLNSKINKDFHFILKSKYKKIKDWRFSLMNSLGGLKNLNQFDQSTSLSYLLERYDRLTMWNSIEGREPFCDTKLIQYLNNLKLNEKLKGGETKSILKEIALDYFDEEFVYRQKMGFSLPIHEWFNQSIYLKKLLNKAMTCEFINSFIDVSKIDIRIQNKDLLFYQNIIWPLISIYLWYSSIDKNQKEIL